MWPLRPSIMTCSRGGKFINFNVIGWCPMTQMSCGSTGFDVIYMYWILDEHLIVAFSSQHLCHSMFTFHHSTTGEI